MSLKDRGTKKWTSLMLPEHIELLKDAFAEFEYKEKPILDEQQIIEINTQLKHALKANLAVEIKYYLDHDFYTSKGKLLNIDTFGGYLRLDDENKEEIYLIDIVDVKVL